MELELENTEDHIGEIIIIKKVKIKKKMIQNDLIW